MKIGLISDTHGHFESSIFEYFKTCDEVWHAGDIGEGNILDTLKKFKPLKAVFGNVDTQTTQQELPENLWMECEGLRILLTHIAGAPPNYNARVKKLLSQHKPDVLIAGHSHILKVERDPNYKLIFINPGAAGNHGFHVMKTIMRFEIENKQLKNVEVIELGKRGKIS